MSDFKKRALDLESDNLDSCLPLDKWVIWAD